LNVGSSPGLSPEPVTRLLSRSCPMKKKRWHEKTCQDSKGLHFEKTFKQGAE
jgi:hypothetical protein